MGKARDVQRSRYSARCNIKLMYLELTRALLLLTLLLSAAIGTAQAEVPAEECSISASELRRNVTDTAQALQTEAQKLTPSLTELGAPKLSDLTKIQPDKAMQSLGEQANRVRKLEWREGASALASGAASGITKGWQGVKEVAPASAHCLRQWTGQASNVVQSVPEPDLTEPMQEPSDSSGVPKRLEPAPPAELPELEVATGVLDSVRRAVMNRVTQQPLQVGSGAIDAVANAFPTAFRLIKYYVIWVVSTSILVTVLLLVILARLTYILLYSSGRSEGKDLK